MLIIDGAQQVADVIALGQHDGLVVRSGNGFDSKEIPGADLCGSNTEVLTSRNLAPR